MASEGKPKTKERAPRKDKGKKRQSKHREDRGDSKRDSSKKPYVPAEERGLSLSVSRVKSVIDSEYINKESNKVIQYLRDIMEHKNPRPVSQKQEPKPKSDKEDSKKSRKRKPKVEPPKFTSKDALPPEAVECINQAYEQYIEHKRKQFITYKLKSKMSKDEADKYRAARKTKKKAVEEKNSPFPGDVEEFDEVKFASQYDRTFFDDFRASLPRVGDPVRRSRETSELKGHRPPRTKTTESIDIEMVSKTRVRFSSDTKVILTAFLEHFVRCLIVNGIYNCCAAGKRTVKVEHAVEESAGFLERNPYLVPLVKGSAVYAKYQEAAKVLQAAKEAAKKAKRAGKELKGAEKQKSRNVPLEKINEEEYFKLYIGGIFKDVKYAVGHGLIKLPPPSKESRGDYEKATISIPFKAFCSKLICELINKITQMLKSEVRTKNIKTITPAVIIQCIIWLHYVCGIPYSPVNEKLRLSVDRYKAYADKRRAEKKRDREDRRKKPDQTESAASTVAASTVAAGAASAASSTAAAASTAQDKDQPKKKDEPKEKERDRGRERDQEDEPRRRRRSR